jgi:ElaB/YqjD/DUF883 family membrane-anchored ribosome-binding protein
VSDDPRREALENAVQEWREKHNIGDDDPLLASIDLWKSFLEVAMSSDSAAKYHEIRHELEELDRLSKTFIKQGREVIEEVRALPKMKESLWMFPYFTVLFVAAGALLMGMLVAKLFL